MRMIGSHPKPDAVRMWQLLLDVGTSGTGLVVLGEHTLRIDSETWSVAEAEGELTLEVTNVHAHAHAHARYVRHAVHEGPMHPPVAAFTPSIFAHAPLSHDVECDKRWHPLSCPHWAHAPIPVVPPPPQPRCRM